MEFSYFEKNFKLFQQCALLPTVDNFDKERSTLAHLASIKNSLGNKKLMFVDWPMILPDVWCQWFEWTLKNFNLNVDHLLFYSLLRIERGAWLKKDRLAYAGLIRDSAENYENPTTVRLLSWKTSFITSSITFTNNVPRYCLAARITRKTVNYWIEEFPQWQFFSDPCKTWYWSVETYLFVPCLDSR